MTDKDNGGPAFPSQWDDKDNEGMTLRDWFAGQALAVLVSERTDCADAARCAYRYADAMLEARK